MVPEVKNRRYYVLTEDEPCWMWSRKEDNSFDWSIIGYNSKVVSPRNEITEDNIKIESDEFAEEFLYWYRKRLTVKDNGLLRINVRQVLKIFKKENGL